MLKIQNLYKNYGTVKAVNGINLEIGTGEFFGLLGPNGAGKTTTVRMISTLTPVTSGTIFISGKKMDRNLAEIKKIVGIVPQHNNLESELSGRENLILHGKIYGMKKQKIGERIDELLDFIELGERSDSPVLQYSGGMKRKLMIARALMHEPKLILLDEPTVGLDAAVRRKMLDLIKKLKEKGITILLTTHYIEEAAALCDRIGMMDQGSLIELDTPDNLIKKVGEIAVDSFENGETKTSFFGSKESAVTFAGEIDGEVKIRAANLEDVFLKLSNRRVDG